MYKYTSHTYIIYCVIKSKTRLAVVKPQVLSQARCLGKVKPVHLALALVEVSLWVEAEAGSLDHPAPEETASLVPLGPEVHHHTSLVSLLTGVYASMVDTNPLLAQ